MSTQPTPPALIRVDEAREVLAYVPHAMGFTPTRSVVALSLRPPRGRIGLVARVDLDDLAGPDGSLVARGVADHLSADGAGGVFLVAYVDGPVRQARRCEAVHRALDMLEARLDVPVRDAWVVADDGYASLRCTDPLCCPEDGHSLALLGTTRIAAAMVVAGSAPVARREDLSIGREESDALRRAFEAGARAEARARTRALADRREDRWRDRRVARCLALLQEPGEVEARRLGELSEAVRDVFVRDLVLVAVLVPSASRATVASLEGSLDVMFSDGVAPPERERVAAARRVLVAAARLSADADRGRLLGVLAWIAWWCGDGAQAQVMASEALELQPQDRLTALVRRALETGMAPGWVARGA